MTVLPGARGGSDGGNHKDRDRYDDDANACEKRRHGMSA